MRDSPKRSFPLKEEEGRLDPLLLVGRSFCFVVQGWALSMSPECKVLEEMAGISRSTGKGLRASYNSLGVGGRNCVVLSDLGSSHLLDEFPDQLGDFSL